MVAASRNSSRWGAYVTLGLALLALTGFPDRANPAPRGTQGGHSYQRAGDATSEAVNTDQPSQPEDQKAGSPDQAGEGDSDNILAGAVIASTVFAFIFAVFAWRLVVIARDQHRAAIAAPPLANKAFLSTHRPKLIVRDIMAPWATDRDGTGIFISFNIANTGDIAAKIEAAHTYCEWLEAKRAVAIPNSSGHTDVPAGTVIPGGEAKTFTHASTVKWDFVQMKMKSDAQDSDDVMAQYAGNAVGLYFTGHLSYSDEGRVRRNTVFRRRYDFERQRFSAISNMELDHAD